jgi:rhamnosyltransferase
MGHRRPPASFIRTYNESKHLPELLDKIVEQTLPKDSFEVILVDSGSTDATLAIAEQHLLHVRIVHIRKDEFSFGRSLNLGCEQALGRVLVFISGHCIPVDQTWLERLIGPIEQDRAAYSYGRQIGNGTSRFSECQLFRKYYPESSKIPQEGFFCNNANAALCRDAWERLRFDEELTGLEDMELAKRLVDNGGMVAYIADAPVYHLHDEAWHKVRLRYQREAIALQAIMPQVHVSLSDFLRYFLSALMLDSGAALEQGCFTRRFGEIVMFRLMQYWGTYRGNHEHRKLSHQAKEAYFYPI